MKQSIILYFFFFLYACNDCNIITANMSYNIAKSRLLCNCDKISTNDSIKQQLNISTNNVFYFCPILVNVSKTATLYQYWTVSSHMTTDVYFITANGNFQKLDTNLSIDELNNLLSKANFKNYQIKRLLRHIQRLKYLNKKNNSVF